MSEHLLMLTYVPPNKNTKQFLIILEDEYKKFVNVDMTTSKGLKRAKDLKLASS